jgi:hypothetical protein
VDVYSRYVKVRSMGHKYKSSIAGTLYILLRIMGKPQIVSGDNEIINSLYERGQLYKEFDGIKLYRTSLHELNKNAIVERMIRTLKQYLIDIWMTYTIDKLHTEFLKFKAKVEPVHKIPLTFVDYLLEFACEINNNKEHHTIHAIPEKVFDELETKKQKIIYKVLSSLSTRNYCYQKT